MSAYNITIQQGESIRLSLSVEDEGAVNARFYATSGEDEIEYTRDFDGLTCDLNYDDTGDLLPGTYDYYIVVTWDDDSKDIIPDAQDCIDEEECDYPKLIVCALPALEEGS